MKKYLALFAAALTLTACGTSSTSSEYTDYSEPTSNYSSAEDEFLYDLHSQGGSRTYNISDPELVSIGYEICSMLNDGATVRDLAAAIAINDTGDEATIKAMTAVTASAVVNLCPEYRYQMD